MSKPISRAEPGIKLQTLQNLFSSKTYLERFKGLSSDEILKVEAIGNRLFEARKKTDHSARTVTEMVNKLIPAATYFEEERFPEHLFLSEKGLRRTPGDERLAALSLLYGTTPAALLDRPEEEIKERFEPYLITIKASMALFVDKNAMAVSAFSTALNTEALKLRTYESGIQFDDLALRDVS